MTLWTVLVIVLILFLIGALPIAGNRYGYAWPGGIVTIILIVILILVLAGKI